MTESTSILTGRARRWSTGTCRSRGGIGVRRRGRRWPTAGAAVLVTDLDKDAAAAVAERISAAGGKAEAPRWTCRDRDSADAAAAQAAALADGSAAHRGQQRGVTKPAMFEKYRRRSRSGCCSTST